MPVRYSFCPPAVGQFTWLGMCAFLLLAWPAISPAYQQRLPDDFGVERLKYGPISEKPAVVLEMIARQSEANYSRIRTWSGTYQLQDKQVHKNPGELLLQALSKASGSKLSGDQPISSIMRGSVEFEVDIAADSFYSRFHGESRSFRQLGSGAALVEVRHGQNALEAGDGYTVATLSTQNSIVTPEHFLHLEPDREHPRFGIRPDAGPKWGRAAFRDPTNDGVSLHLATVVDPRRLFTESQSSAGWDVARRIAETIRTLALDSMPSQGWQELKDAKPKITIMRADTPSGAVYRVRFVVHSAPQKTLRCDYTFDGRVGFNLTHKKMTETGGRVTSWMDWTYKKYDGIFVPESVIKVNTDAETNRLSFQRNLDLEDCVLNGPLHPDGFSYQRLGLKDGERVVDRIESKLFILDQGQLVEVTEGEPADQPIEARKSNWKLIVGLNVVALVVMIVFVYLRKRRRAGM